MTRTILAAAVLMGLAACSKSGSQQSSTRARTSHPVAAQSKTGTTAAPSQTQQKKKGAAKPDTGRAKNPLTNN